MFLYFRTVGSELKRDKLCVQQSMSRCNGPDRGLLQRRFDGRIGSLYDQFYKHCRPSSLTTTKAPPTNATHEPTTGTGNFVLFFILYRKRRVLNEILARVSHPSGRAIAHRSTHTCLRCWYIFCEMQLVIHIYNRA